MCSNRGRRFACYGAAVLLVGCGGHGTSVGCPADGICSATCPSDPDCPAGGGTGGQAGASSLECTGVDALCVATPLADCLGVVGCAQRTTTPALGGYRWTLWQNPGSTAAWQFPPEATRVGAVFVSQAESNAGTSFELDPGALPVDLSGYAELSFTADLGADAPFEVGLTSGVGTRGCTWDLAGVAGSSTYVVTLAAPSSYWQNEDVAFDLTNVEVVSFTCDWLTAAALDIVLTDVTLR